MFGLELALGTLITIGVAVAALAAFLFGRVLRIYRIVPPDIALVITGGRRGVRIVSGGYAIVWPFINQAQEISLGLMLIKKTGDAVKTQSGMTVQIDWYAQARFSPDEESLKTAARLFLGRNVDDIKKDIEEVLSGNMRAIAGDLRVDQMHNDRDAFIEAVQNTAKDELQQLGVEVILGIQEITDNDGFFEALAGPIIAEAKKNDRVAKAEAQKQASIAEEDSRQKSEQARFTADTQILTQNQEFELRTVEKDKIVALEKALAEEEVNAKRALAEKNKQEAEILVPARAARDASEIKAEGDRKRITITAEAEAHATRETANAEAEALSAKLLAEAEGKRKLAEAIAAEGNVNLIQYIAELTADADIRKTQQISEALKGIGENVRIWDFSGAEGGKNSLTKLLYQLPPMIQAFSEESESVSGESLEQTIARFLTLVKNPESLLELQDELADAATVKATPAKSKATEEKS